MILGTKEQLVRFSFCKVFEAASVLGSEPKFSTQVMIPKTYTKQVEAIKKAIKDAIALGVSKGMFTKAITSNPAFRTALRDGDQEAAEHADGSKDYLKGHYFFNASCKEDSPPAVVDRFAKPIMNRNEFYSGCYGCIDVNFYPFKFGKGGVAAGLNSVMKREDGEHLDGRVDAETAFAQVVDDESESASDELV